MRGRKTASLLVRNLSHYRREAFVSGLERLGYDVKFTVQGSPGPGDILVIWNRYGVGEMKAREFIRAGAAVIVSENGYLDFKDTRKTFAMALYHHNGAGNWEIHGGGRVAMLDVDVLPWRGDGTKGDILLLPQRGIGPKGVAMPKSWVSDVTTRIRRIEPRRTIRVRRHPGTQKNVQPLSDNLAGVGVCVTWASGAGLKSLLLGCPTVFEGRHWIGADAGSYGIESLSAPARGSRESMLRRVSWAQWTLEEVEGGEPFRRLVELHSNLRGEGG